MKKLGRARLVALIVAVCIAAMLALPAMGMAAIHVTKTASPTALTAGPGPVTYTYTVTNTDQQEWLVNVVLTDDKLGVVSSPSGDTNSNSTLEPGETWVYTKSTTLSSTTTNIATVTGTYVESDSVSDTASATVTVTGAASGEQTVDGGDIPETGSPWYNVLLVGGVLTLAGAAGVVVAARRSHA